MQNLGGNRVYYGGFENREYANPCLQFFASSFARGSSCVVSGFGHVLKSDPLVSSAEDISALLVAHKKKPLVPRVHMLIIS